MKTLEHKSEINKLYNQDIAPEDSQKTSFYYHKTLALQCIIAICSGLMIISGVSSRFYQNIFHEFIIKDLMLAFTILHIASLALETFSRIKWMQQKKDLQQSALKQLILWGIQTILLIPIPNRWITGELPMNSVTGVTVYMDIDDLLTLYILIRIIYVLKFLVHSELFYGSRPDRLSRLYTVKFGTYNAIKFLINEKAELVIITISVINFIYLPIALLLLQGRVNENLNNFLSCVHFLIVTQVTVGYGDINVITPIGRGFSLFCILIGVTYSSLLLILFMRLMQQTNQQQQSQFLLNHMEKRVQLTKARVLRIQNQWQYAKKHCTPEQQPYYQQKIQKFRFSNRRHIMLQRQQSNNLKRLMLSNFSNILQLLTTLKQKQQILSKYIKVIQKAQKKQDTQDEVKHKLQNLKQRQNRTTNRMMAQIIFQ